MNTKRFLLMAMSMFMSLMLAAEEVVIDGIKYNVIKKTGTAEVIANSYSQDIVIPSSFVYDGTTYSVTSIGECAFCDCSLPTSVTIPNSVTNIGYGAFSGCTSLTSVTIPNSVTSIGGSAFSGCTSLTSVIIGNSVTNIGYSAFSDCTSLTSVTIPNSVTSIGDMVFICCTSLTSVTIPEGVTSIGNYAFWNCSSLTSVTIPNSVTSIGEWAFRGCSGLTSVIIGNSVTSIGQYAFCECSSLSTIIIGSGINIIYGLAFAVCPELTHVYCYAENVPAMEMMGVFDAFTGSYIEYATLHVPAAALEDYKSTSPWSTFGTIVALTDEELSVTPVKTAELKKSSVYDLSGRSIQHLSKGIRIINGKKLLVR